MKAALYYGPGDVRIQETPRPEPGPGEVLVRIHVALTCGTDVKTYLRGHHLYRPPQVFGHELAGEVAAVGPGVTRFRVGDRVVPHNSAPCNRCYYCKAGQPSLCDDLLFMLGAYAEYIVVPARIVEQNLFHIPNGVPMHEAALTEPLACAVYAVAETPIQMGDTVVVMGAGPIGLMITALAARRGARVIQVARTSRRFAVARELGAAETVATGEVDDPVAAIRSLTPDGRGADAVIEAVGQPEAWEQAVLLARKGGQVTWFGGCKSGTTVTLDTRLVHYSQLTLRGLFHTTPWHVQTAFDLIAGRKLPVAPLVSAELPLDRAVEALELHRQQQAVKVAIVP